MILQFPTKTDDYRRVSVFQESLRESDMCDKIDILYAKAFMHNADAISAVMTSLIDDDMATQSLIKLLHICGCPAQVKGNEITKAAKISAVNEFIIDMEVALKGGISDE